MKKMIVLEQSLVNPLYELLLKMVKNLNDYELLFYRNFENNIRCSGVIDHYKNLLRCLDENNINYKFIDEFGLDEYLYYNHSQDELYLTPTGAINAIVSSAAILEYKGPVFVCVGFNKTLNKPKFQNIQPMTKNYMTSKSFGTKGMDLHSIGNPLYYRGICHFELDGKKYSQKINDYDVVSSGIEGESFICKENNNLRIKIYIRNIFGYEIERIKKMICISSQLKDISIPLTLVYDDKNMPIGVVIKNFSGKDIDLHTFRNNKNAISIAKDIARQVIAMQTYGIYHKDLIHNILCDFEKGEAHIIDVDTTQYLEYPAIASTADKSNGIPQKYYNDLLFYNSVDLSYSLLTIIISTFVDPDDLFGLWDKNGNIILREEYLDTLKVKFPIIYQLVVDAYVKNIPISFSRQLDALDKIGIKEKTILYNPNKKHKRFSFDDELFSELDINDDELFDNFKQENVIQEKYKKGNNLNNINYKEISKLQKIILDLFLRNAKTTIAGETDAERWERFIRQKQWIKPLVYTVIGMILIIMLLIGFFLL